MPCFSRVTPTVDSTTDTVTQDTVVNIQVVQDEVQEISSVKYLSEEQRIQPAINAVVDRRNNSIYGRREMAPPETFPRRVVVVGSGDYGRAFASRAARSGYKVTLASRRPNNLVDKEELTAVAVTSVEEAFASPETSASLMVICVPRCAYASLPLARLNPGQIIVDVSNTATKVNSVESNAEHLQALAPHCHVVKSFNVISSFVLQHQQGRKVYISGDDVWARQCVMRLTTDLSLTPVDMGSLQASREIEGMPHQLFPEWKSAVLVASSIFIMFWLYILFKYQLCETALSHSEWRIAAFKNVIMVNFNRTLAMTAITVLAATYLPGVVASYVQLYRGTKYRRFPVWLHRWMVMRKQLGLISLLLSVLHASISASVWSPRYVQSAYDPPTLILTHLAPSDHSQPPNSSLSSSSLTQVTVYNQGMHARGQLFLTSVGTVIVNKCRTKTLILAVICMTISSPFYLSQAYEQATLIWAQVVGASSMFHHQVAVFDATRQGRAEFGLTLGAVSLCLLVVIGVTSLPSVGAALSWREFNFIQSGLGWSALLGSTLHNIMIGWEFMVVDYTCSTPSPLQVGLYLPLITVALKLPLLVPPIAKHLTALRNGHERKKNKEMS